MEKDVAVVVVTFEDLEHALNYRQDTGLDWPVVIDSKLELYDYFGMNRASFWDIWGISTWKAYLVELLKGNIPQRAHGDTHQRGGDVLIDPEGMVVLHHIGKGPADRPDIHDVLALVPDTDE